MKCDKCGNNFTRNIIINGVKKRGSGRRTTCYECSPYVERKFVESIKRTCKICGTIYDSTTAHDAKLTCGSPQCYRSRASSNKYLEAMASTEHKHKSNSSQNLKENGYNYHCCVCDAIIVHEKPYKRPASLKCEKCVGDNLCVICNLEPIYSQRRCKVCFIKHFKTCALKSLSKRSVVSKVETYVLDNLNFQIDRNNRTLLDGYEIDGYVEKLNLAIDYRGPWHFNKIVDQKSLDNTIKRDRIKERLAKSKNITLYPISWASTSHHKPDIEIFILNQLLLDITPWKFNFDLDLFKIEFERLRKSKANRFLICQNIIEWYFKHLWSYVSKSHKLSAFEHWNLYSDVVIENRKKYSDLTPRSLRRYYKLFDYSPSIFQDSLAKNWAQSINGDVILDPFAGFGGRLLGTCACNKHYIGIEQDQMTVSALKVMSSDLGLNSTIISGDASKKCDIECDGVITSPPFFDKDGYVKYKSLDHYLDIMAQVFTKLKVRDKVIIDFKPVTGCTLDDFLKTLPTKNLVITEINFGGLNRKSIHYKIEYCLS